MRSSANVNAGAQSRVSAIVHGVLLLVSVFALAGLINQIPLASLAAILIHTGIKLAKPSLFLSVAKQGPGAFAPFIATIIGVLAMDLLFGIALGLAVVVFMVACANLRGPVMFAQHDDHYLRKIPDQSAVIIDTTRADYIDHDVRDLIDAFVVDARGRGITVEIGQQPHHAKERNGRWLFRNQTAR